MRWSHYSVNALIAISEALDERNFFTSISMAAASCTEFTLWGIVVVSFSFFPLPTGASANFYIEITLLTPWFFHTFVILALCEWCSFIKHHSAKLNPSVILKTRFTFATCLLNIAHSNGVSFGLTPSSFWCTKQIIIGAAFKIPMWLQQNDNILCGQDTQSKPLTNVWNCYRPKTRDLC